MRKIYLIVAAVCVVAIVWGLTEYLGTEAPPDAQPGVPQVKASQVETPQADVSSVPPGLPLAQLGAATAPVTIIEYSSLTCPHCATFHNDVLDLVRRDYIDTGKVRLVFHDFFFDPVGLMAAQLARCVAPEQYFGMLAVLFRAQESWATSPDPRTALTETVRLGGLGKAQVDACLADQALRRKLVERRQEGEALYQIQATPTFIINGRKVQGSLPYEAFREILDRALMDAGQ